MKRSKKSLFVNVKSLTFCAMLVSLSVILAIIAKLIPQGVPFLRFTFENLPIIASGFIFGPIAGGIVGILCDLVSCLVIPQQSFNPLITLGPCAIGIISGLLFKYCFNGKKKYIFFLLSTLFSHLIGSVIIKSYPLSLIFQIPYIAIIIPRSAVYLCIAILESLMLYFILNNSVITSLIQSILKKDGRK